MARVLGTLTGTSYANGGPWGHNLLDGFAGGWARHPASATAHTLDVSPGSFVVTGDPAQLLAARLIDLATGSVSVTGDAAQLLAARLLSTTAAAYQVTGSPAALVAARILNLASAAYAITGNPADLVTGSAGAFILLASPGSLTITGSSADFAAPQRGGASVGGPSLEKQLLAYLRRDDEELALLAGLLT